MKGVSHENRLKSCSRTGGAQAPEPGEANRRAAAQANPIEPRNTKMRVAKVSEITKPASVREPTKPHGTLRGKREQARWDRSVGNLGDPRGAGGVSRPQPALGRSHKSME